MKEDDSRDRSHHLPPAAVNPPDDESRARTSAALLSITISRTSCTVNFTFLAEAILSVQRRNKKKSQIQAIHSRNRSVSAVRNRFEQSPGAYL